MATRGRSLSRGGWVRLGGLFVLLALLSCSGSDTSGIGNGPLVRLHLQGLDPSTSRAVLGVMTQDQSGQQKTGSQEFSSGPFDVLGVSFPPGTVVSTTYTVDVYKDNCLLGHGTAMLAIDRDGEFDVNVQLTPPPLACGADSVHVIVQVVKGSGGDGTVTSVGTAGISCGTMCDAYFPVGTQLNLQANATTGTFQSWSGGCSGSQPTCMLPLSSKGEILIQAVFAKAGACRGWCEEPSGVTDTLYGVWGSGPLNVIAVGANGTIVRWDGQAWNKQASGVSTTLRGVMLPRDASGSFVAVGDGGTILTQSGAAWQKAPAISGNPNLNGIAADTSNDVFIVGDNGTLIKGSVGGSYTVRPADGNINDPPSSMAGKKVSAISVALGGNNFTFVGDGGFNLRRYSAGLDYFTNGAAGTTQNLYATFYGSSAIFAGGIGGTLVRRGPPNGFGTWPDWTVQTSPVTSTIRGMWGASDSAVYAVGDALTIAYFDGTVWGKVALPNITTGLTRNLYAIWGTSANNLYAVGDSGTILHFLP